MEKPDEKGFVTINWPSKNIPFGGVFHNRSVQQSSASQDFLKVLLKESKLSVAQRERSRWENQLRVETSGRGSSSVTVMQPAPARPRTSRRRSLSAIRDSGVFDNDGYRPLKRGEDREKLKERLQKTMEYGDYDQQQMPLKAQQLKKQTQKLPTAKETRNELLTQIRERADWLAEMEALGAAAPHRDIVNDQIAERIRAIDALAINTRRTSSARSSSTGSQTVQRRGTDTSSDKSTGVSSDVVQNKKKATRSAGETRTKLDENVAAYNHIPKLRYSPRRRC